MLQKHRQSDIEMFCIYDSKSESYQAPMMEKNQHTLIRDLTNMMRDPSQAKNTLLTNAEDYAVFIIGNFCYRTGTMEPKTPTHIVNLIDLRSIVQNEKKDPQSPAALIPT